MGETNLQLLRCVSNALWPKLRKRRWEAYTESRAISPTGNPRGHNYAPGAIPGPEPTIEVYQHIHYIWAVALPHETRLGHGIYTRLTRTAAYAALARLPAATAADYEEALDDETLRFQYPFVWKGAHYRRNDALTRRAAIALQAVAVAATTRPTTDEENARVLEETNINALEVFAAVERGA